MSNEEPERKKPRLSLLEIVVILVIIGMLVALLLPAQQSGPRNSALRMRCANNMKHLALALHTYHDKFKTFPPAYTVDAEGKPLHSWRTLVLPYMEQEELFREIRLDEPWDSEYNRRFHERMPDIFACPSAGLESGETTYRLVTGPGTLFPGSECRSLDDLTRETDDIPMLVETETAVCWMAPVDLPVEALEHGVMRPGSDVLAIGSLHRVGANVAWSDGSVRFLENGMTAYQIRELRERDQNRKAE